MASQRKKILLGIVALSLTAWFSPLMAANFCVSLQSVDTKGKCSTFGAEPTSNTTDSKPRFALVIGNKKYNTGWDDLPNPEQDVESIGQALRKTGFRTRICKNLTKVEMQSEICAHARSIEPIEEKEIDPIGLIYYAGHGVQFENQNYLVPIDDKREGKIQTHDQSLFVDDVLRVLNGAHNTLNIVFFDACRNNPYTSDNRNTSEHGLAQINFVVGANGGYRKGEFFTGFSADYGKTAWDGVENGGGPFANAFKLIVGGTTENEGANGIIQLVFHRISQLTSGYADSVNHHQIPILAGGSKQDFCFNDCALNYARVKNLYDDSTVTPSFPGQIGATSSYFDFHFENYVPTNEKLVVRTVSMESEGNTDIRKTIDIEGAPDSSNIEKPSNIFVNPYGDGPYKTISSALEVIADGGVIEIAAGVYNESLDIRRSVAMFGSVDTLNEIALLQGLLQSRGFYDGPLNGAYDRKTKAAVRRWQRADGRKVTGELSAEEKEFIPNAPGVEIVAPMNEPCIEIIGGPFTVHLQNLSFQAKINSFAEACVNIQSGNVRLYESDVLGSGITPAIKVSGGSVQLVRNRITAGSEGIFVEQPHALSSTVIMDNKIYHNKTGIDIAGGSRSTVMVAGNEVFNNLDAGIKSSGYNNVGIIGNKINNNRGVGIFIDRYTSLATIRHNEIVRNEGDAIAIPHGANAVIEDNEIVGNSGRSISIGETTDGLNPKVTKNYIRNNDGDKKRRRNRR